MTHHDLDDLLHDAFRYASALTHNADQAREIVQEACLAVIKARGPWSKAYVFRSVRHRFIDLCRSRKVTVNQGQPPQDRLARNGDPDEIGEAAESLTEALGRLRSEEREALYLSTVQGMSATQIGALLEAPRSTILSLLHRSRTKLARMLAPTERPSTHSENRCHEFPAT